MNFEWDHYLEVAENLCRHASETEEEEACFRSAISRAYYAVFHESRVYLNDSGLMHAQVYNTLRDRPSRIDKQLFEAFRLTRRSREVADYERSKEVHAEDAEKVIRSARKFIELARM